MKLYKNLIFAGTFDHFHIGHKKMLERAFSTAEHVSIGITTEKLYRLKPLANLIFTASVRKVALEQYLRKRNWLKRATFFRLDNIYGPSVKDSSFDAILVTNATKKNALKVNEIRKVKGLKKLNIITAPFVLADDGKPVTSERIRAGEIDREGHNFHFSIFSSLKGYLRLPEYLRQELRKPLGRVIKSQIPNSRSTSSGSRAKSRDNFELKPNSQFPNEKILAATAKKTFNLIKNLKPTMVVSVGDVVTMSLMQVGFDPDVKIVDLRSRRQEISNFQFPISKFQIYNTKNDAGTIDCQAVDAIQQSFKNFFTTGKKQLIIVKGEEDLLALPAILFAPLNSIVLYGQWNLGVVMVEITESKKKEIEGIIEKFV